MKDTEATIQQLIKQPEYNWFIHRARLSTLLYAALITFTLCTIFQQPINLSPYVGQTVMLVIIYSTCHLIYLNSKEYGDPNQQAFNTTYREHLTKLLAAINQGNDPHLIKLYKSLKR